MHIAVIRIGTLSSFPPAISLVSCLLDLGHTVSLLANEVSSIPARLGDNGNLHLVELGNRKLARDRVKQTFIARQRVGRYFDDNRGTIDAVWTTTDISARESAHAIRGIPHIMQLSELVEYVPAVLQRPMPFHSRKVPELARCAARVVVPEYNRAHIQKALWGLPDTPAVLPNKPYPDEEFLEASSPLIDKFRNEQRKIILYQGVFNADRDLEPYSKAIELLRGAYVLFLMGSIEKQSEQRVESLCQQYPNTEYIGFAPSPTHLSCTSYGHIGLLPYKPGKTDMRWSPLNALYCAPNKIWEYAKYGLPMIGTDVPGLAYPFQRYGIGEVSNGRPDDIAEKISRIESAYGTYSTNARSFYASVDVKEAVAQILKEAGAYGRRNLV